MGRKTYEIAKLVDYANLTLAESTHPAEMRKGTMQFIERVLMDSGNYAGFRHLSQEEVPEGQLPGIHYNNVKLLSYEERFENTDNTRVMYFMKS